MLDWAWWFLACVHLLAGAAWFGAMFYSLIALHPRASKFFADDDEQFERFVSTIAAGARWKVLGAFALIGLSGLFMIPLSGPRPASPHWIAIILAKTILWLTAIAIFCRISWRLWPARVFALPAELPAIRRQFRMSAIALICIAAAAMALGVLAHGR